MNFDRKAYMNWARNAQNTNPSGQDYHNSQKNPAMLGYNPKKPIELNEVSNNEGYSLPKKTIKNRASRKMISEMIKKGKQS